jgi:hypothetical protein
MLNLCFIMHLVLVIMHLVLLGVWHLQAEQSIVVPIGRQTTILSIGLSMASQGFATVRVPPSKGNNLYAQVPILFRFTWPVWFLSRSNSLSAATSPVAKQSRQLMINLPPGQALGPLLTHCGPKRQSDRPSGASCLSHST